MGKNWPSKDRLKMPIRRRDGRDEAKGEEQWVGAVYRKRKWRKLK
jgi:hypothetical protein